VRLLVRAAVVGVAATAVMDLGGEIVRRTTGLATLTAGCSAAGSGTCAAGGSVHGVRSRLELSRILAAAKLQDPDGEGVTKWKHLHNAVGAVRRR
jgi:hypothetical protein